LKTFASHVHLINTDAAPNLLHPHRLCYGRLKLEGKGTMHVGIGKVRIQRHTDGELYVSDKRVVAYRPSLWRGGKGEGLTVTPALAALDQEKRTLLNSNVYDFLFSHKSLVPASWRDVTVRFLGTRLSNDKGELYSPCISVYEDGRVLFSEDWLEYACFNEFSAAASLG